MSLQLGELSIALELDNDRLRAGMAQAKRELEGLPPVAQREVRKVSDIMDREGRAAGGKLAQGINSGLIRNSPLIVAGVAGALVAGAPLMIAAAGTMFAGIGAVAAAQTLEVRQAWTDLGHDIRDGAVEDAAVLVPVYTQMAEQIGEAFQGLRPQLRDAFADSAPLIESTTDGVIALAENAMPGLVRAIATGEPVFDGLEHFLSATGAGLTDFFDAISGHSPAAGSAFASLGDVLGELLPILGELLGQGAEIAADVLPAVAYATGTVLDVMQALGPLLPSVVAGFVAFKIARTAAGYLQTFAVQAQFATTAMSGSAAAGSKVGGALSSVGKALPILGIALGAVGSVMAAAEQQTNDWAQALLEGGDAADQARQKMAAQEGLFDSTASKLSNLVMGTTNWANALGVGTDASEDAEQAARDLIAAMSPLEQAQSKVTYWTNELSSRLNDESASASDVEAAQRRLAHWTEESERAQADLEIAVHGVTSAMVEQASLALAAADSSFAYRDATSKLAEQVVVLSETLADPKASANDLAAAMREVEEDVLKVARAAGELAADDLRLAPGMERDAVAARGTLTELERLRAEMGSNFPPALQETIARLQITAGQMNVSGITAQALSTDMQNLGVSVQEIPNQKFVQVDAPTGPQIQQMKDLGYAVVNLPNGDVYVAANTADAEAAIALAARNRVAWITVRATLPDLNGAVSGNGRPGLATGGPVFGPGTGTSDSIPARLSNGEHVLTAREVQAAGGHGQIMAWRKSLTSGSGYAEGGSVPRGSGGSAPSGGRTTSIIVEARTSDERRIAKAITDRMRDDEFLAGVR